MAGWKVVQMQNTAKHAHYPWWPLKEYDSVYHTATRLPGGDREGPLVDSGAYDKLMGDAWAKR
eukprot:5683435-Prorocentrum_lima.AAC.1